MTINAPYRAQIVAGSGLDFLAAAWLLGSPMVLRYSATAPSATINNIVFAVIIGVISLVCAFGAFQAARLNWVVALVGIWVVVSPWAMGFAHHPAILWNNVATGALITISAAWSAWACMAADPNDLVSPVEREFEERTRAEPPAP